MLVREAMTSAVVYVTPETTVHEAATALATHRIASMPVVDGDGRLVGVVSEADIVRHALIPDQRSHLLLVPVREGPSARCVAEVMTTQPVTVGPDTDLAEAVRLMTSGVVKSLPVVRGDQVVGVISRADVVRQLARRDDRVRSEVDVLVRSEDLDWIVAVLDGVVTLHGPQSEADRRLARLLAGSVHGVTAVRFAEKSLLPHQTTPVRPEET